MAKEDFCKAEKEGRVMTERIVLPLPGVYGITANSIEDVIDFELQSGDTFTCLETKYRKGHNHNEYFDVRIQWRKYEALRKRKGFLLQIFEDSWWLWYIGDTDPCETGVWTHSKHTVLGDDLVTDRFAAFSYNDAIYHHIK